MIQREMCDARKNKLIGDTLLLLEHPPVYTLGLQANVKNFREPIDAFRKKGIDIFRADRGGDVTFHGPGQLVGYPIVNIAARGQDVRQYVHQLEKILIETLSVFHIHSEHMTGYPGVWIGEEKISAIGIKVNVKGIASHGFALNVNTDLSFFDPIIPCGLKNKGVTSMAQVLKKPVPMEPVTKRLSEAFIREFS